MTPSPYDLLAPAYDQETHSRTATEFIAVLRALALEAGLKPRRWLDIGCGTGVLSTELCGTAEQIVAVDLSWGMLTRARGRLATRANVSLVCANMLVLPFGATFDAVAACNEVINQLPSPQLERFFTEVAAALSPRGYFCFDALTREHFARFWDGRHWEEQSDNTVLWMDCHWEASAGRGVASCSALSNDSGPWTLRPTTLVEYLHEPATIARALKAAGLRVERQVPWNPYPEPQPPAYVDRHLWVCVPNLILLRPGLAQVR